MSAQGERPFLATEIGWVVHVRRPGTGSDQRGISVKRNVIGHVLNASGVGYNVVCVRFVQMYKL